MNDKTPTAIENTGVEIPTWLVVPILFGFTWCFGTLSCLALGSAPSWAASGSFAAVLGGFVGWIIIILSAAAISIPWPIRSSCCVRRWCGYQPLSTNTLLSASSSLQV